MLLYESSDVASLAGVTPAAVRLAVRAGRLVPDARTNRGSLFAPETVERWLKSRRAKRGRCIVGRS